MNCHFKKISRIFAYFCVRCGVKPVAHREQGACRLIVMKSRNVKIVSRILAIFAVATVVTEMSYAQNGTTESMAIPPVKPTYDAKNVNIIEGVFKFNLGEISIGPNSRPLMHKYIIENWQTTFNIIGKMTFTDKHNGFKYFELFWEDLSDTLLGSSSDISTYESTFGSGGKISGTLTAPVYTSSKGDRLFFYPIPWLDLSGASHYRLMKVEFSDGEEWVFNYQIFGTVNKSTRVNSVVTNRGFVIYIKYESDAYSQNMDPKNPFFNIKKVYSVNASYEYCNYSLPGCDLGERWPYISYTTLWNPGLRQTISGPKGTAEVSFGDYTLKLHNQHVIEKYSTEYRYNCYSDEYRFGLRKIESGSLVWNYYPSQNHTDCTGGQRSLTVTDPLGGVNIYRYNPKEPEIFNTGPPDYSVLLSWSDPLGRTTSYEYGWYGRLTKTIDPDLSSWENAYDARGNVVSVTRRAKPGSGLPDQVVEAKSYPVTCIYPTSCNKPLTVTDANGNTSSFTYDPIHGEVLTETKPTVGGIASVKRYSYVQRYAWIKNAAGDYLRAASPIWLLAEQRTCRTTATLDSACAGGGSDEIIESYDYGPDSGPNNLLLRGVVVTADGQAERTCYGYDMMGRKISETKPRADLTSCP